MMWHNVKWHDMTYHTTSQHNTLNHSTAQKTSKHSTTHFGFFFCFDFLIPFPLSIAARNGFSIGDGITIFWQSFSVRLPFIKELVDTSLGQLLFVEDEDKDVWGASRVWLSLERGLRGALTVEEGGFNLKLTHDMVELALLPKGNEFPSCSSADLASHDWEKLSWDAFMLRPPNLSVKSCENWENGNWFESSWDNSKWLGSVQLLSALLFPNIAKNLPRFLRISGEYIVAELLRKEFWSRGVHSLGQLSSWLKNDSCMAESQTVQLFPE